MYGLSADQVPADISWTSFVIGTGINNYFHVKQRMQLSQQQWWKLMYGWIFVSPLNDDSNYLPIPHFIWIMSWKRRRWWEMIRRSDEDRSILMSHGHNDYICKYLTVCFTSQSIEWVCLNYVSFWFGYMISLWNRLTRPQTQNPKVQETPIVVIFV